MMPSALRKVELVRHRCRGHCRPGAEAGSQSGTEVPKPRWDRGAETSHRNRQNEVPSVKVHLMRPRQDSNLRHQV